MNSLSAEIDQLIETYLALRNEHRKTVALAHRLLRQREKDSLQIRNLETLLEEERQLNTAGSKKKYERPVWYGNISALKSFDVKEKLRT